MPEENIDDSTFINLVKSSFIGSKDNDDEQKGDIRQEIIYDLLLVCLGIVQNNTNNDSSKRLTVKERFDKIVSNTKSKELTDTLLTPKISTSQVMQLGEYDSRARAILFEITKSIEIPSSVVIGLEKVVAQYLYFFQQQGQGKHGNSNDNNEIDSNIQELHNSANASLTVHENEKKKWRWMATGVGVVVGATAIGLTGGLGTSLKIIIIT